MYDMTQHKSSLQDLSQLLSAGIPSVISLTLLVGVPPCLLLLQSCSPAGCSSLLLEGLPLQVAANSPGAILELAG